MLKNKVVPEQSADVITCYNYHFLGVRYQLGWLRWLWYR